MSENETQTKVAVSPELTRIIDASYGHMGRFFDYYNKRVMFTERGKARMGQIIGFITAMYMGGSPDRDIISEKLAQDIDAKLKQLSSSRNLTDFRVGKDLRHFDSDGDLIDAEEEDSRASIQVPSSKAVLGDDGTFMGFNVTWYRPIHFEVFREAELKAAEDMAINGETTENGIMIKYLSRRELAMRRLKVVERINPHDCYSEELSHYFYEPMAGGTDKIHYAPSHPGGLIYHGPGAGQTFTTNFGDNTLWGIHT